jgi:uncharacterized protein YbbK (DUF523 family)
LTVEKILVSACLLGEPVRYDGGDKLCRDEILQRWVREGRVVPVCPELAGGLPVPRLPSEVAGGLGGAAVLSGEARVVDNRGHDVTEHFVAGAESALASARANGIRIAVLKEGSPSCGSLWSYDGSFSSARVPLPGVTGALLERAGIRVFGEDRLAEARTFLEALESGKLR